MLPLTSPIAWIIWLLAASLCAYHSKRKGRNPYVWFFIGFFASFLGLYILFLLPKSKKQPKLPKRTEEPPPITLGIRLGNYPHPFWYYLDEEHKTQGPISLQALESAWNEKKLHEGSFIWNEGLDSWKKIKEFMQKTS